MVKNFYTIILAEILENARELSQFENMDFKCGYYIFVMAFVPASTKKRGSIGLYFHRRKRKCMRYFT